MRAFGVLAFALRALGTPVWGRRRSPLLPGRQLSRGSRRRRSPGACRRASVRPGETPPKGTAVIRGQVLAATGTADPARAGARDVDGRARRRRRDEHRRRGQLRDQGTDRRPLHHHRHARAVSSPRQFGQRRPGEPGTPIELSDGQIADKVNFALSRGGVIAGRILDDWRRSGRRDARSWPCAMPSSNGGTRRLMPAAARAATTAPTTRAASACTACRRATITSAPPTGP